jgi:hypothetical protein
MAQQQPIRVVVEKKPSGCWGFLRLMQLIGLAVEYWYVSLGILAPHLCDRGGGPVQSENGAEAR